MKNWSFENGFEERVLATIRGDFRVFGPVAGDDGVTRLKAVAAWHEIRPPALPLIPPKKFLLPAKDPVWTLRGNRYETPPEPDPTALVGLPVCDLLALGYLDRVFADDDRYAARRERLFLVGIACEPGPDCFCRPRQEPPPFDLFLGKNRVWSGTASGRACLERLEDALTDERDEPFRAEEYGAGQGAGFAADLQERFHASLGRPFWKETADRCLSCGACAAVCPTCYCYDVVDETEPEGPVIRRREWDNCFFRNHGLVAGGHNFRPSRTERLKFRFEHKLLGFGSLRGISSCVGCGRCGRACPVDIDIADLHQRLVTGEVP